MNKVNEYRIFEAAYKLNLTCKEIYKYTQENPWNANDAYKYNCYCFVNSVRRWKSIILSERVTYELSILNIFNMFENQPFVTLNEKEKLIKSFNMILIQ